LAPRFSAIPASLFRKIPKPYFSSSHFFLFRRGREEAAQRRMRSWFDIFQALCFPLRREIIITALQALSRQKAIFVEIGKFIGKKNNSLDKRKIFVILRSDIKYSKDEEWEE